MKTFWVAMLSFFLLLLLPSVSFAVSDNAATPVIPEKNGDYPDPAHPGIRVRVFVHSPKDTTLGSAAACTADEPSSVVVGDTGWKLPSGTVSYYVNTSSVPASVGGANLLTIAQNGFSTWSGSIASTSPKPVLSYAGTTTKEKSSYDSQNIIAWGRTSGNALGVTYTRYTTATRLVVDVDTIMNQKFSWTYNTCSATSYDAADILMHELGHWYGLDDEYAAGYVHNTMYGYGAKAENKKITPTAGDIAGLNLIYH